ncbi:hypothetical protein V7S43_009123 [Phytophthora oleae]|uniref:Uncharacterized protein n=1 Tax=Phytophthora oleae TaxID=2107226 RepID=A0ABD3FIK4_9STRA
MARLEGRDQMERYRLLLEHTAYLEGKRDDGEDRAPVRTASPTTARRPPVGKVTSYIADLKARAAAKEAAAKPRVGKKKLIKKQQAELAPEKKATKEAKAVARAEAAVSLRSAAKKRERKRVATLGDLKRKRADRSSAVAKAKKKKKKQTSSSAVDDNDGDADDERGNLAALQVSDTVSTKSSPDNSGSTEQHTEGGEMDPADSTRGLSEVTGESQVLGSPGISSTYTNEAVASAATPAESLEEEEALTSDVDCEDEGDVFGGVFEGHEDANEEDDSASGGDSDGGLDGAALLALRKTRAKHDDLELEQTFERRDAGACAGPSSAEEDVSVWVELLDSSTHPVQNEPYPGLFSGEHGPTEEVLDKAESPLQLFFFFMPPSLWLWIASDSNRYYHQHLNQSVDRMYARKVAQDPDATREEVLLQETTKHKKINAEEIVHCIGLLVTRIP